MLVKLTPGMNKLIHFLDEDYDEGVEEQLVDEDDGPSWEISCTLSSPLTKRLSCGSLIRSCPTLLNYW